MKHYEELLAYIQQLKIIDTHEHLPREKDRSPKTDILEEWLSHYFSSDLISAGISDADLARARDNSQDLLQRWTLLAPYWNAARTTGYGRALTLAARDIYGIEKIDASTIEALNAAFCAARDKGGHYQHVLREKSGIALSIVDNSMPNQTEKDDPHFMETLHVNKFLMPTHLRVLRQRGAEIGIKIHTLDGWEEWVRQSMQRAFHPQSRIACLKCSLAYARSLHYEKPSKAAAETEFVKIFDEEHIVAHRDGIGIVPVLENYLMHFVCQIADEMALPFQFHTGLQEGNGNIIANSNPVLMSNLFMEYGDIKFDIFHMGYPYCMELSNLAKNFRNVNIDMCWGHIISPEAARRALSEWLDAVPANKISAFGGDYLFVDGVYGHQKMARENVAMVLAEKVTNGSFDLERAKEIANWLFFDNPKRIFGLENKIPKD